MCLNMAYECVGVYVGAVFLSLLFLCNFFLVHICVRISHSALSRVELLCMWRILFFLCVSLLFLFMQVDLVLVKGKCRGKGKGKSDRVLFSFCCCCCKLFSLVPSFQSYFSFACVSEHTVPMHHSLSSE